MKTHIEVQDKILEIQVQYNKKSKIYLQYQIDILNWVLEQSDTSSVSTEEVQKDGINIEFG